MTNDQQDPVKRGFLARLWYNFRHPSTRYSLGTLLVGGFIAGIIFWGGFNTAMEATNNETFLYFLPRNGSQRLSGI